jgi:hypothetical protein
MIYSCRVCGCMFDGGKGNARTCSLECRREHEIRLKRTWRATRPKRPLLRRCPVCERAFDRRNRGHAAKTCSEACGILWRRKVKHRYDEAHKKRHPEKFRYCIVCAKLFDPRERGFGGTAITCSPACGVKRKRDVAVTYSKKKYPGKFRLCANCGRSFQVFGPKRCCSAWCDKGYKAILRARIKRRYRLRQKELAAKAGTKPGTSATVQPQV